MPVIELLLLPALPLVKVTTLVKLLALEGVKLMTRLVEPEPGRLKGVPERIVNGPPLTVATPLLRGSPPMLVNTTTLLMLMALVGAKLTATKPVAPGARLKGVPLWIAKGKVVATAPVRVRPPLFTT